VNLADLVLGLAFLAFILAGVRWGLAGLVLLAAAAITSFVTAGVVAIWVSSLPGIPKVLSYLALPGTFFLTLILVGAILNFVARRATGLAHRLPFSIVDRLLGAGVAAGLGVVLLSFAVLVVLELPPRNRVTDEVEAGRASLLLLRGGAGIMSTLARPLPLLAPLAVRLEAARDELGTRVTVPEGV
jgi:hypothetical protein